ncbi:MAG: putative acetyltransferase [Granulosicoccus sp.]
MIRQHLAGSDAIGDDTSNHTLAADGLNAPHIKFWTISEDDTLLGCAALKSLPDAMVEIKSMHVLKQARGRGIAQTLLAYLIAQARTDGSGELVLETGSMDAYAAARALYERAGFSYCAPISGYCEEPNSVYMRLALDPARQ